MGTSNRYENDFIPDVKEEYEKIMQDRKKERKRKIDDGDNLTIPDQPEKKLSSSTARKYKGQLGIKSLKKQRKVQTRSWIAKPPNLFTCLHVMVFLTQSSEAVPEASLISHTYSLGGNVYLHCFCDGWPDYAKWSTEENNTALAIRNKSSDSQKFIPTICKKNGFSTYNLTILNFTLNDFGSYFCECNFKRSNSVILDNKNLLYQPNLNDVLFEVNKSQTCMNITTTIEKISPKPRCRIKIQALNWTDMFISEGSIFYTAVRTSVIQSEDLPCVFNIILQCDLHFVNCSMTKQLDYCEGNEENKSRTIAIVTSVTCVLAAAGCCFLYIFRRYKQHLRQENAKQGCRDEEINMDTRNSLLSNPTST